MEYSPVSCSNLNRSIVNYHIWSRGEPNNGGYGNVPEKCAMYNGRRGAWNDYPCDTKFNFMCKMKGGKLNDCTLYFEKGLELFCFEKLGL